MDFEGLTSDEFHANVEKDAASGHWHWRGPVTAHGIPYLWIKGNAYRARRIAWAFRFERLLDDTTVEMTCGCSDCVSPEHARELRVERVPEVSAISGRNKLTASEIMDIRARFEKGSRQVDLAREYGVSQPQISMITRNLVWKHVH